VPLVILLDLTLALLMLRVLLADNPNDAFATNDPTVVAHLLD